MKKLIIGFIAIALTLSFGTVYAQGNDEPPIANYLSNSSALATYNGLPADYQSLANEAFVQFQTETPAEHLLEHIEWLIEVLDDHYSKVESGVVMSLPGFVADLFSVPGYSSAFTGLLGGAKEVHAEVAVDGQWSHAWCTDCQFISAVLFKPTTPGHHTTWSTHYTKKPPVPPVYNFASVWVP